MYKVLLADDEPSHIESMKEHIDWEKYDMEVAYCVYSGKEAFEIIEKKAPDLAILDIRMPGYSGLDLSKYIFKNNLKTRVIIVSGYAEFSYAQKAIQYGVLGYCLKPVEYDEIVTLLLKAVHAMQDTKELSDDDFLEAIEENNAQDILSYLEEKGFSREKFFIAASIGTPMTDIDNTFCFKVGNNVYGYLSDKPFDSDALRRFAAQNPDTGIAVYPKETSIAKLRSSLFRTMSMGYHSFIEPGVNYCDEYYSVSSLHSLREIQDAISFSETERVRKLLEGLKLDIEKRRYTIQDATQLYNSIISNRKFIQDSQDYYVYSFRQLIHQFKNFDELIDELIKLLDNDTTADESSTDISNFYFLKIMKYINTYYQNDISLSDVAAVVNLNPNYISQVFKKSTGTTFSHYLTNLRITNAQKLLRSTDDSINEISVQSGFNDYFYFLKTFKKYTGYTPSEYRRNSDLV